VTAPELPNAARLTRGQHSGWNCVLCHARLTRGAVCAGRAEGRIGAHDMGIDVYACPSCATRYGITDRPGGTPR
jgi:hypothetical protein